MGRTTQDKLRLREKATSPSLSCPHRGLCFRETQGWDEAPLGRNRGQGGRGSEPPCGGAAWRQVGDDTVPTARLGVSPEHCVLPKRTPSASPSLLGTRGESLFSSSHTHGQEEAWPGLDALLPRKSLRHIRHALVSEDTACLILSEMRKELETTSNGSGRERQKKLFSKIDCSVSLGHIKFLEVTGI